jgi:hypothetical protein
VANTKQLKDPAKRKRVKQAKRRELKALYAKLSRQQRTEFAKSNVGLRAFLARTPKAST